MRRLEMMTSIDDHQIVVWHESGHAVAARLLGFDVPQVTVERTLQCSRGEVLTTTDPENWRCPSWVKASAVVNIAATHVVRRRFPSLSQEQVGFGAEQDWKNIESAIEWLRQYRGIPKTEQFDRTQAYYDLS
jgi:hypothetical protein